jgi:ABC-type nickel/cobalt efflux system permease component RcnA
MSARARSALLLLAAALALALAAPAVAPAHPLGNFTTNQLTQVRIDRDQVRVHYVLDQAEIPTFQQVQRFDADGNGRIDGAERGPLLDEILAEARGGLALSEDGRRLRLGRAEHVRLSYPPGQGGLTLTRVEAELAAPLPDPRGDVELVNDAFEDRVGWNAIQILPGDGADVASSVAATEPTDELRSYPQDLLSSPPDEREASFQVAPGSGRIDAPAGLDAGETTEDRAQDGFANALAGGDTHGLLILFLLAAAFGWGALHALSPGHGKAMVAGYLVGARGTPRDAAILGLTVTVTHTIAVFAFGLVVLAASQYVVPERLYPWLGVASGAMVIAIGFWVVRSRFRRWRALRSHEHAHSDAHSHEHEHDHGHGDGHSHGHDHDHHHHPAPDEPITMRGLLALGVSGGLVPCPSALVVLIAAISQHRVGLGMVLILAFSLGLAATLTAVGLAVVWSGRLIQRLRLERRLLGGRIAGALPALSAGLIVAAGVLITVRAIPQL